MNNLSLILYILFFAIFFFTTLKHTFSTKKDMFGIIYKKYGKLGKVGRILIFIFIMFTLLWGKIFWF